jgi:hypothetical protein
LAVAAPLGNDEARVQRARRCRAGVCRVSLETGQNADRLPCRILSGAETSTTSTRS